VSRIAFVNATLVLPDRLLPEGGVGVADGRIVPLAELRNRRDAEWLDLSGTYLAPGFIDLHVHGGDGADFMDLTPEAFRTVCRCHARHGTTSLTPTSTVARYEQYERFLHLCHEIGDTGGSRILGGHLYGPYFVPEAKGCHPVRDFLTPDPARDEQLLSYAGKGLKTLTVAPELPDVGRLVRAARERGLLVTAGHSYATFPQVEAAVGWGVRHVDHLFCAMSDRARLRQAQTYPMRGGVMEATLALDELTTEVIADGKHLTAELLRLAYKVKGPDRLALVTDAMRAVDLPDGEYWFGPEGDGELVRRLDDVGVTLDGKALASGVMGMDHCVRTFHRLTGVPLPQVVRMATLTPARILGVDTEYGSLEPGKAADLVVLDADLTVRQVYVGGTRVV
jgi:N-acetylglucosamine-6-phosphate deacetylase